MEKEIYKICTQLNDGQIAVTEATEQLLEMFSTKIQDNNKLSLSEALPLIDKIEDAISEGLEQNELDKVRDALNAMGDIIDENWMFR